MSDYKEVIKDFAKRTMSNLSTIDELRKKEIEDKGTKENATIFETTQLINSLLGLIVFPREGGFTIPSTSLIKLKSKGWTIPKITKGSETSQKLNLYIERLRNAITHNNLEFTTDERDEITGIHFWDEKIKGSKDWETVINLLEIRNFTDNFLKMILNDKNPNLIKR